MASCDKFQNLTWVARTAIEALAGLIVLIDSVEKTLDAEKEGKK